MRQDQASQTAQLITRGLVLMGREDRYRPLTRGKSLEFLEQVLAMDPANAKFMQRVDSPWMRKMLLIRANLIVPGLVLHIGLRKQAVQAQAVKLIESGRVHQVVSLGAGWDPLLFDLSRRFGVFTLEVDHGATQKLKRQALARWSSDHNPNNVLVSADFAVPGQLERALETAKGFDPAKPTLVIAEGLLQFFSLQDVRRLLREIKKSCQPGHLLFSFAHQSLRQEVQSSFRLRISQALLARFREPYLWSTSTADLNQELAAIGLQSLWMRPTHTFQEQFLGHKDSGRVSPFEWLCLAEARLKEMQG